jgi:predicted phosphodiesterase
VIKDDFDIITKKIVTKDDVKVYPVGDLHVGAIQANLKGWERFNQIILDDPNAYVIFLGDMMNNATRSSVSNLYEDIMRPRDQKIYLKEHLMDLAKADRILAILPGNHENRSLKDADDSPLYDVAAKLDLEDIYRDNIAFIKLLVGPTSRYNPYTLFVSHGNGGGKFTGSSVNRYEQYSANYEGVDVFYFGHSHKPFVTKPNKIYVNAQKGLIKRRNTIVTTGASWLAYGGYPVRNLMSPAHEADPDQPMTTVFSAKHSKKQIRFIW